MKTAVVLLAAALIGAPRLLRAQAPAVSVTLEPEHLAAGEATVLRITIAGSIRIKGTPDLALRNLQVESGPSIESHFEWINGRSSSETILVYRLRALKAGSASVGPVHITDSSDRTLESPQATAIVGAPNPRAGPVESAPASSDPALVARIDPARPYAGQQAIWNLYLLTRARATQGEIKSLPDFKGFWAEDLDREANASPQVWNIGGVLWRAYPMIRKAIFGNRPGTLPIGSARAVIAIRSELFDIFADSPFADSRPVERESPPAAVLCRPVPEVAGRLPVGTFTLRVSVDRPEIPAAGSCTVTAALTGDGRLTDVDPPDLAVAGARISEPESRLSLRRGGGRLTSTRTWQWVVTPEKAGTLTIPAIRISTFNPASGRVVESASAPIPLRAAGIPAPVEPTTLPTPPPRRLERSFPAPSVLVPVLIPVALLLLAIGYRLGRGRDQSEETALAVRAENPEAEVARMLDALQARALGRGGAGAGEVARLRDELARVAFSPQISSRDEALAHLDKEARRLAKRWRVRV